jgi:hypothetical protein
MHEKLALPSPGGDGGGEAGGTTAGSGKPIPGVAGPGGTATGSLDPKIPVPAGDDDEDGLTNKEEYDAGTNPKKNDTDQDGLPDKWEVDNGCDPSDESDGGPAFVSATGDDSAGNGTEGKQYLTLGKAIARAQVGLTPEARTVTVVGTLSEANADTPRRNGALFSIADTGEAGITIAGKEGTDPKLAKLIQSGVSFVHTRILHLEPGTRVGLENITVTGGESQNGAGIYVDRAELTLDTGCEITGNTADAGSGGFGGGGILAKKSTLIMREGSSVSGNTAESLTGGGIFLQSSQFTMDGGEISGNSSQFGGAGLYLNEESTAVIKNNARITGNISIDGGGGGIGLSEVSVLTLEDTLIEGNWAVSAGGVYVHNTLWTYNDSSPGVRR